ncbi:MAG: transcriptional regulator [Bacteroides sp.]|jgi:DNA-binding CsgD family transcriptional regulator/ligand-binding sensor domain-containing protein|nr:transcriptional regulator [Bacteroides sp.]
MKQFTSCSFIALVLFALFPCSKVLADWNNFIVNFDKSVYGKGAQTWQIAPYDDQWVYFANKNGVVQFDGNEWTVFPLNNHSDVRSVLASTAQKKIYVGGINEFGYYSPDDNGGMVYCCMSDTLGNSYTSIGNVWGIHEADNILYFQGDDRVVKCINGKYTVIKMNAKIDCSDMVNGTLYIGTNHGVWILVGNTFFPLQGAGFLASMRIRGIIPYKAGGVIIVTAYNGLFYCNGRTTVPFITGAEQFMRENEVFCVATQDDKIVLGTIHKGLVLVDCSTMKVKYFNENNGLRNNTVLSVAFDRRGNLWAGLDSGLDYVCLNSSFTNLYSYPHSYGAGYTAICEGTYLYLGTNRGLYYTSYPVKLNGNLPDIRSVEHSSGQVWNLQQVGNELFCLHDRGIFIVKGTTMKRVANITGAWCCQLVVGHPDLLYVGVYSGLYLLKKQAGEWKVVCKIDGISDSCRLFEQETSRLLWICNPNNVVRVELNEGLTRAVEVRSYGVSDDFPSNRELYVSKIRGHIYFATPHGVYRYNRNKDKMEICSDYNNLLNGTAPYARILEYHNHLISLSSHEICIANLGTYKKGADTNISPIRQSLLELVPTFESIIPLSDSLMVLPNEGGFSLFNLFSNNIRQEGKHSVYIRDMYLSYPKDSLVYTANFLSKKPTPVIGYTQNSVRFDYGSSFFMMDDDLRFQYRLNKGEWSDYTTMRTKEYSNLSEGDYTFEVKVIYFDGTTASDEISFRVLPPWYRSIPAYIFYFILILSFLWWIYKWDDVRVQRKKQQAVMEKDEKMREMEKEYEEEKTKQEKQIMELEKERLEYDLKHKSQEMANLMIDFLRKNETLTEIKSEIVKVASFLKGENGREGKQKLLIINSKIDANIQSDEVLKRIEDQFDLVHNNFMKRLHAKHPDLSNNERMMCAYLKMNLSTKEIAPLLNISVRGVETIRYRLRKKFGLEREDSLIYYLDNKL